MFKSIKTLQREEGWVSHMTNWEFYLNSNELISNKLRNSKTFTPHLVSLHDRSPGVHIFTIYTLVKYQNTIIASVNKYEYKKRGKK